MSLTENYLTQISPLLPKGGRDDILAELRDSMQERVAEATASGMSHRDAELHAVARLGHPIQVAGRFHPQQYLIGPGIYPAWRFLLGRVLVALLAAHLVLSLFILPLLDITLSLADVIDHLAAVLVWGAFFITLGFAVVEYTGERLRFFERWTAASLQQASTRPLRFGDTVWNILVEGLFLLWWNGVLVLDPGSGVQGGPVWADIHWPANLLVGAQFLLHLSLILRGYWSRRSLYAEILLNLGVIALLATVACADVVIAATGQSTLPQQVLVNFIHGACIVIGLVLLWDIRRALGPLIDSASPQPRT